METKQQVADKSALLATKMRFLQKRLRHLRRQKNDSYRLQAEILREVKAIDKDVSALLEQLRPYRIAIAGMISSGKSTFVNKALLSEKLLGASKGRTTKLPMELAYRGDSEKYRVTVEFVDESSLQSLLKFLGQWELRKKRKERPGPDETKEIDAAKVRMKKLFSNVDEVLREIGDLERVAQVSSLLLRKTKTTKSIGSLPLVQEVTSIKKVKEVIAKFSKKPWIWVVQSIRVEGPFEFLPAGVVVVDTPGLGDPDQVTSERTEAQLSAADEVWHLSPSAHSFAVDTEGMAVVRSLTDGGESRTVRVVVTKCRGGLPDDDDHEDKDDDEEDDDEEDNEDEDDEEEAVEDKPPCGDDNNGADNVTARDPVQLVRSNLVAAHRRGRSVASMSAEEQTEWEQKLPVIQKRVDAIPLVFTEFSEPMVGVDEVREWLQVLSVARAESLSALEIAFATTVDRLEDLFTQQIIHIPAPCTTAELATWWTAVDNACNQLTAAMNTLPASMSPGSYHWMVALNRWARDPAARTRDGSVYWQTGVAIMRKRGHHITAYGTRYDLSLDIVNRYTAYLHPLKECVTALRRAALSLDANDARFTAARETLKVEFYQTELRFGFESHQRIEQELQPLYERYSSCDITWDYKGQTVRFFKREDIDEIAERGREDIQRFVEHIIETVKSTYHRLVTPIDVTKPVSPSYKKVLKQVRAITVVPPAVEDEDNVCPISWAPFTDPVSLRCGHCFDRSSLKLLVQANPWSRCPICRQRPVGAPNTWRSRLDVLVRCSLAVPSAAPAADWCATMTAAVEMELRREVEDAAAYSAAAEVGQLTASAEAMHLGPVAAPPSLVLGPALGPGPVPLPVPVPVPVPASGSFPNPAPAAAEGAMILPPPAAHK